MTTAKGVGKGRGKRPNRKKETINTSGLKRAPDSQAGVQRVIFPSFRVNQEDLDAVNVYCEINHIDRAVLMRKMIKEFLEANR